MCGIAGIFSLSGRPIENGETRIREMTNQLIHRGPDGKNIYISPDKNLYLGHTRLAIVDPECQITQPMQSIDGKNILSFNGEIYSWPEKKLDLEQKGIVFRSHMDTEILLEGLRYYGISFLEELDGMWAFAFYDVPNRKLLLSRDIMGERHIFYRITNDYLIFASEPKPIILDTSDHLKWDFQEIVNALQFSSPAAGKTLLKEIRRLDPGHNIVADTKGKVEISRYRRLHPEKWFDFFNQNPSIDDVIEKYEELFLSVCQRRIPTEVDYLCTLSGGIDSSLVCLFASEFGARKIKTLHANSQKEQRKVGTDLSEMETAVKTAQILKTDHRIIDIYDYDCIPVLKYTFSNAIDGSIEGVAPFEMLAKYANQTGHKVMLISDGPDELLGGYISDLNSERVSHFARFNPIRTSIIRKLTGIKGGKRFLTKIGYKDSFLAALNQFSDNPFRSLPIHYAGDIRKIVPYSEFKKSQSIYGTLKDTAYSEITRYLDVSQKIALAYATNSLPNHFNLRTDKAFMHQSIEVRLPHQAPEMVEFLISVPAKYRFKNSDNGKLLMREVVKRKLGTYVSERNKYGFSVPFWNNPAVYREMRFNEVLCNSSILKDFPFLPETAAISMRNKKLLPRMAVLASTYENFKAITHR